MANLYWGGTGTWNSSSTTNWFTDAARTVPASAAPTSADDVFIDNTGSSSCTTGTGAVARDATIGGSGATVTFTATAALSLYGSLTIASSGVTMTGSAGCTFLASDSRTITVGITLPNNYNLTFNGSGTFTLGSNLTLGNNAGITVTQGTFSTGASNYSLSISSLTSNSGATSRTISFNASSVAINGNINFGTTSQSLTFNAGTSTITNNAQNPTISGNGYTFYNLSFTRGSNDTYTINGANTFNNLSVAGGTAGGGSQTILAFGANQTISGSFSNSSSASGILYRAIVKSSVAGTQRTISAGNISNLLYFEFQDINASSTWDLSANACGDLGGNSNITFPSAKTVYWNLAGTQSYTSNGWCTSTDGGVTFSSPSTSNFPLAQDTAIFTNNSSITTFTVSYGYCIANFDLSARTSAMTLGNPASAITFYGDFKLGSGVTMNATISSSNFLSRGSKTINTGSVSVQAPFIIDCFNGTYTLGSNFNGSGIRAAFTVNSGTFDTANYNMTCLSFSSASSSTRTINLGSSTIDCYTTSGTIWNTGTTTGLTFNGASSTITFSDSTTNSSTRTFAGGGLTFGTFNIGGGAATGQIITITGSNTFSNITTTKTVAWTLNFTANTTTTFAAWNLSGTAGNLITVKSATNAGHTLVYTEASYVSADYLAISYSNAKPSNYKWFAGANSTNSGNNTGWWFSVPITGQTGNMFLVF